eukprot:3458489-Rhodomonas_salina.1
MVCLSDARDTRLKTQQEASISVFCTNDLFRAPFPPASQAKHMPTPDCTQDSDSDVLSRL